MENEEKRAIGLSSNKFEKQTVDVFCTSTDLHPDNRLNQGDLLYPRDTEVSFIPFANQCVGQDLSNGLSRRETDEDVLSSYEEENSDQVALDCKSSLAKLPITNPTTLLLKSRVDLIRQRYTIKGKIASISDILVDFPHITEALLVDKNWNSSGVAKNYRALPKIFNNPSGKIGSEHLSLWNFIIDLYRTIILYGMNIGLDELRTVMVRTLLIYSNLMEDLQSLKVIEVNGCSFKLDSSRWMKVVKYKLAAFAAYAKNSDILPKSPFSIKVNPRDLIFPRFGTWFTSIKGSKDNDLFIMSLTDSLCRGVKKGCDRPNDDDCIISCLETVKLFNEPRLAPDYELITSDLLFAEIDRTLHEIIIDDIDYDLSSCPSFSAASDSPLQKGGHVKVVKKYVKQYPHKIIFTEKEGIFSKPYPLDGFNNTLESNPRCYEALESKDTDLSHAFEKYGDCIHGTFTQFDHNPNWDLNDLDIENLASIALEKDSIIKPVALKESLKTRGITTPPALESWLLKPLQRYLFQQLRHFKCFAVIGETLKVENISSVIKRLPLGKFILSGDYDNATNMVLVKYTRHIIKNICRILKLGPNLSKLAEISVCDCMLDYKFKYKDQSINLYLQQKEAQPMGKILSFPILCILNFMVCRKAIEYDNYNIQVPISNFPGLINGDDCVFPIYNYKHWEGIASMVGLNHSIGKTFISKDFLEMNSRTFLVKGIEHSSYLIDLTFTEVPFINFGLMKGLVRSSSEEYKSKPINGCLESVTSTEINSSVGRMGWCHNQLVSNLLFMFEDLDYLFKFYHNKYLLDKRLCGIPYYMPSWLGGLGLHPGLLPENKLTIQQLMGAHFIYQHITNRMYRPQYLTESKTCILDDIFESIPEVKKLQDTPFTRVSEYGSELNLSIDIDDSYQEAYKHFIEYLWRSFDLSKFFNEIDEDFRLASEKIMKKKLYHNQRLWFTASRCIGDTTLQWFALWQRKQRRVKPLIAGSSERNLRETIALS